MKKVLLFLLAITIGIAMITSFSLESVAQKFVKKEPVKIGYSVYDMQQPYWQLYAKGLENSGIIINELRTVEGGGKI